MTCYHPLMGYRVKGGGRLTFDERRRDVLCAQQIPCGQCFGCRRDRAMRWGIRCMHEASMYPGPYSNASLTLTYEDEFMPAGRTLRKDHTKKFIQDLRNAIRPGTLRFFMAGEYSPFDIRRSGNGLRPHYHGLIFGFGFPDRFKWKKSQTGRMLFRSKLLEKVWPYGEAMIGDVTFESAAYTARYAMKKLNGELGREAYRILDQYGQPIPRLDEDGEQLLDEETGDPLWLERQREYAHMSTHPGIGAAWLQKYQKQTFTWDSVIVNGRKCPVPKYYDRLFEREDPDRLVELKFDRQKRAEKHAADCTPERLAVREQVAKAKAAFFEKGRS